MGMAIETTITLVSGPSTQVMSSAITTHSTIYHPNSRANRSLESHIPTRNKTIATAIRSVFVVPGATARVMRSAEDARPDARELNVLVFL